MVCMMNRPIVKRRRITTSMLGTLTFFKDWFMDATYNVVYILSTHYTHTKHAYLSHI